MPSTLNGLTTVFIIFFLFLPGAFIPFGTHSINGEVVTFKEFWLLGGGPTFCFIGIVFPLIAIGFLHKHKWSRIAPIILVIALAVGALFFTDNYDLKDMFFLFAFLSVTIWYFLVTTHPI